MQDGISVTKTDLAAMGYGSLGKIGLLACANGSFLSRHCDDGTSVVQAMDGITVRLR